MSPGLFHILDCMYRHLQDDKESTDYLCNQLVLTGQEPPKVLQQFLSIASIRVSEATLKFLCSEMISHPLSVFSQAAANIATKLIDGKNCCIFCNIIMLIICIY